MTEYTIHVGMTHKTPLDQYENIDISVNMTVKVESDTLPKLSSKELKAMDAIQAEMTTVIVQRVKGEGDLIIARWLERGKLKELRAKYEEEQAAAMAKEAKKKGVSLLGPPPEEETWGPPLVTRRIRYDFLTLPNISNIVVWSTRSEPPSCPC